MNTTIVTLTVNGTPHTLAGAPGMTLLELLREELELTGAKLGCGVGECGACTVLVEGEPVNSCLYLAVWAQGKSVTTIEGVEGPGGELSDVQKHFVKAGAVQCGFCTPGFVLSTTAMVESGREYTDDEIRLELSGHFCRCTGYEKIFDAAKTCLCEQGSHREEKK